MQEKNFTVYKSSAGSGKTFTLVKEYLSLALRDPSPTPKAYRHILAITFTNKAAAEMKERIISALRLIADENGSEKRMQLIELLLADEVLNKQNDLTDAILRKRADNVLTEILHHYTDFAIGTIDSFVSKVVRTFAFDLKIPMSFDLELDEDKLLTQAIDLLLAQIGSDEKITQALVEFTESKADEEKSWHIENELKLFAKNLLTDEGSIHIEKLKQLQVDDFFNIKNQLKTELKTFEEKVKKEATQATTIIKNVGLSNKDFYRGVSGIGAYFEKLSKGNMDAITPNSYVQATVEEDKWHTDKTPKQTQADIESIKTALLRCFRNIQLIKDEGYADYIVFSLINTNIYSLAVLNEIEKLLIDYKSQNNIVHISEFNKMIAKVVLNEPVPFIYERLGERYHNYLIDEFQDTSVLQFQNLLPLIENALAQNNFTMLVGDGKQAIYRWRGGEVEQFSMLPKIYGHQENPLVAEREDALIRNYNPRMLDKNYRSKKEIIEFNNAFFRTLSSKLDKRFHPIYENLEQGFNPENTGGYVQVEFLNGEDKETWRENNLLRTFEIIQDLQKQHYLLKDIVVLVRKNTDGSDVANYLSQRGIPVISSDSLLLINSAEINFLIALLLYLNNNEDRLVQAELLEYFIASKKINDSDIHRLLELSHEKGFHFVIKKVCPAFNTYHLLKLPLYELCEEFILLFDLNIPANAYVQFFLDEVLTYSIKHNSNINDFLNYWEDKKNNFSLVIPKGMNAVTIMTIHKSKGLEFPVVIYSFAGKGSNNKPKNLWIDLENEKIAQLSSAIVPAKQDLELTAYSELYVEETNKSYLDILNVLYVALTRPEERLYVLSETPSKKEPEILRSMSDMFAYYYKATGKWDDSKTVYSYGSPSLHQQKHNEEKTNIISNLSLDKIEHLNSSRWRESIKMRTAAPSIWNLEEVNTKKDYGVLVHTALALVKSHEDVDLAINKMMGEGLLHTEEKEKLKITLNSVVQHPLLKAYFERGLLVKNEMDIITKQGESFRPDRIVIDNNKAIVIDYKTGEEKVTHQKQILEYADLLTHMGFEVTEKLLVYIEEEKVVKV